MTSIAYPAGWWVGSVSTVMQHEILDELRRTGDFEAAKRRVHRCVRVARATAAEVNMGLDRGRVHISYGTKSIEGRSRARLGFIGTDREQIRELAAQKVYALTVERMIRRRFISPAEMDWKAYSA